MIIELATMLKYWNLKTNNELGKYYVFNSNINIVLSNIFNLKTFFKYLQMYSVLKTYKIIIFAIKVEKSSGLYHFPKSKFYISYPPNLNVA